VLRQDYKNLEYIVIDGGSTDGTAEIIKEYAGRISLFIQENDNGIAEAFNKGIMHATGDLLAFLNADDEYLENVLQALSERWNARSRTADVIYGSVIVLQSNVPPRIAKARYPDKKETIVPFVCHQAMLAKRSLFMKIGNFNTTLRFGMDYDWILRALEANAVFQVEPDILVAKYSFDGYSARNIRKSFAEFKCIALNHRMNSAFSVHMRYLLMDASLIIQKVLSPVLPVRLLQRLKHLLKNHDAANNPTSAL